MSARRWLVIGLIAFVATGLAIVVAFFAALNPYKSLPSDVSLLTKWEQHRADFEIMAAMALPDSALVGAGVGIPAFGFSVYVRDKPKSNRMIFYPEMVRTGRIRYLLRRAGVPAIARSSNGVWFTVRSNMDASKGLIYSKKALAPLVPTLDGLEKAAGNGYVTAAYREVAPGWYLFLRASD
jgi:hypothetical protein